MAPADWHAIPIYHRVPFRVKAANNDGFWNTKGASLLIIIHAPWWAYLLYTLVGIGAVWGFVRYCSRALRRENYVLEQKVAQRTRQVLEQSEELKVQRDNLAQTLTHLEATQAKLIQSEKLASLGELTAGIAHEIQNPLNFVNNFADVSAEIMGEVRQKETKANPDPQLITDLLADVEANLKKISQHGYRASNIVKGMLEHSRPSTGEMQPANLNALASDYLKLAYQGMRAKNSSFNCELVTHFEVNISEVRVVTQDISRVLLNVYSNAFYAVQQRATKLNNSVSEGSSTRQGADYQPTVTVSTRYLTHQAEVRVSDNGVGMPEAIQQKIFPPFFTTRPTGEGTGLGLSLSYDIITKGHGGSLTVAGQENEGTEFIITLPI